jgi:acetyl esterase/lipase
VSADRSGAAEHTPEACTTVAYGSHPDQVADLYLPDGPPPPAGWAIVVLLHGGFWRERYRRELMAALARDLVAHGWAVWNVEYRRVRGAGGWPTTLEDVAAAVDHLADLDAPVDLGRLAVVGHSAGGHLALWVAGRMRLPEGAPGGRPRIVPRAVVGQAPVADLRAAEAAGLSDGAVREFLGGGPAEVPERYLAADPAELVGHGLPVLLVHGHGDTDVPCEQSESYLAQATLAGDRVELEIGPGGHMGLIDPASDAWRRVRDWLATR